MQTTRDRLAAYRYLLRRVHASMLGNDPEAREQPMRRVAGATGLSFLVGALVCGGIAGWGWLKGTTSADWARKSGTLIIVKESGARYVLMDEGGKKVLREVLNFTSAQLILGKSRPPTTSISLGSLADPSLARFNLTKGPPIGIPGAPDALPAEKNLASSPWVVCSRPKRTNDTRESAYQTDVVVGLNIKGGDDAQGKTIVARAESRRYLIWEGKRLPIDDAALAALNIQAAEVKVSTKWTNALPLGDVVAAPKVPESGSPADYSVNGVRATVGDLYQVEGAGDQGYYLAHTDGLHRMAPVQGKLLDAAGHSSKSVPSSAVQALGNENRLDAVLKPGDLPSNVPEVVSTRDPNAGTVCLSYDDKTGPDRARLTVNGEVPDPKALDPSGLTNQTADHTIVPTGRAALVAVPPKNTGSNPKYFIITDTGQSFAADGSETLAKLGYAGPAVTEPVMINELVLKLVPSGPGLNQKDAGTVAVNAATPDLGGPVGN